MLLLLLFLGFCSAWELTLLHVNDIHVRMEETNKYSASCKEKDANAGKCFGGLARLHKAVNDIRHKEENVLWLNAGDFYQGTIWYTQFKWRVVSQFNNALDFDAMTLGNHEFDDKVEGLVPFLQNQSCPVIVTNLNTSLVPQLDDLYVRSVVKEINGHMVGLVGYITPHTKFISNSGKVIFMDEIESLRSEVANLKAKGVKTIVAIGHSGYSRDIEIAKSVPDLDVVVGGHSHSFLFSPTRSVPNPSTNTVRGPYPTIVEHEGSTPTLVVQAYAFTKYLGHVKLELNDASGGLEKWSGSPILLDSSFEKDSGIEQALQPWRQQLLEFTGKVVGSAAKDLFLSRGKESTLGNWVADAMVGAWKGKQVPGGGAVKIGLINSGAIRSAFNEGNITLADLLSAFPFQNTFDVSTLLGRSLRLALEHSVFPMDSKGNAGSGQFLQVSGLKIIFDVRRPPGDRLIQVKVLSEDGTYVDLEEEKEYSVVTPNYIASGGDGYKFESWSTRDRILGSLDTEVLQGVLDRDSPITSQVEGRIILVKDGMDLNEVGVSLTSKGESLARGATAGLPEAFLLLASLLFASL